MGNEELVRCLLARQRRASHSEDDFRSLVDMTDYDGRTPLHLAATEGHSAVARILLENGATTHVRDRWGQLPLEIARRHRHKKVIAALRAAARVGSSASRRGSVASRHSMSSVDGTDDEDARAHRSASVSNSSVNVPLLDVVSTQDVAASPRALQQKFGTVVVTASTRLLIEAAARGDVDEIRHLVAKGADVNAEDYDGRTPLHLAAACGQVQVVKYLLRLKATQVTVFDRFGTTPLGEAMRTGDDAGRAIAALLKAHGAVNIRPVVGARLCGFSAAGHLDKLVEEDAAGEDLNSADYEGTARACQFSIPVLSCVSCSLLDFFRMAGRTALHLAACEGHIDVVRWLLDIGVNTNAVDRFGHTPLDDARREKQPQCVELLDSAREQIMSMMAVAKWRARAAAGGASEGESIGARATQSASSTSLRQGGRSTLLQSLI